jgi:hypothetical protein
MTRPRLKDPAGEMVLETAVKRGCGTADYFQSSPFHSGYR